LNPTISLGALPEKDEGRPANAAARHSADFNGEFRAGRGWELPRGLRLRGLFSIGWSGATQVATMIVRLGSTLVMTRLLAPEAYGVFATALAVVITLEWFSDLGVMPALVRHPEGDSRVYLDTGWWINALRGLSLSLICIAIAYPLTRYYYHKPNLFLVLLALSSISTIQAVRSPGMPLLRRELNYRAICIMDLAQLLVGTAVSLLLAWWLRSVWAIVWGTVAGSAAQTVVSYILCPMAPGWTWDRRVATEISRLSRQILVNTLVAALWMNADRLLGLGYATEAQMGLYAVAFSLVSFMEGLALRFSEIYFSMLSRITDPKEQLAWHQRICERIVYWGMPVLSLGVLAAPMAVRILYDRRYLGAGILFALLIARLMARLLGMIQFQHLLATAEIRIATRSYVVAGVVQVALLMTLGQAYGVNGIAISGLLSTMVLTGTQSLLIRRRGEPSIRVMLVTFAYVVTSVLVLYKLSG
jgi:O-antigen/teichoic acid export membrane protein